jgi:DNA-binding transcriptional ArsR family regulator
MVQSATTDDVFYALSNSTRRKVLERLSDGPATVSDLAAPFDMKLPSFVQHLSVLERSRLVKSKKHGRVRTYEIVPERFKVAEDWLEARRQEWEARLDRFDQYVRQLKERESGS